MQAKCADERRSPRSKVMLAAMVRHEEGQTRVRVLDLSSHGALIVGGSLPPMNSTVTLHCGSQSVAGWVAWRSGKQAGLHFDQKVSRQDFAPQASFSHAVILDNHKADARRPGFRGNQLSAEERFFMNQLLSDHSIPTSPL